MSSDTSFGQIALIGSAIAGLLVTGIVIERRVLRSRETIETPISARAGEVRIEDWDQLIAEGARTGPAEARVTMLVFGDFECPACRQFEKSGLRGIREDLGGEVAIVYRHWPLPYHRSARPAALASICAGKQGHFWPMHDQLFAWQDSLASAPMWRFARRAGVSDSAAFDACMQGGAGAELLARDDSAARRVGISATPSIIINGKWLQYVPDSAELAGYIRRELVASR